MPAESWRMRPARSSSLCEITSASAGSSRRVGIKNLDPRIDRAFSLSDCELGKFAGAEALSYHHVLSLTSLQEGLRPMKIALASDHAGSTEKERLKTLLTDLGVACVD